MTRHATDSRLCRPSVRKGGRDDCIQGVECHWIASEDAARPRHLGRCQSGGARHPGGARRAFRTHRRRAGALRGAARLLCAHRRWRCIDRAEQPHPRRDRSAHDPRTELRHPLSARCRWPARGRARDGRERPVRRDVRARRLNSTPRVPGAGAGSYLVSDLAHLRCAKPTGDDRPAGTENGPAGGRGQNGNSARHAAAAHRCRSNFHQWCERRAREPQLQWPHRAADDLRPCSACGRNCRCRSRHLRRRAGGRLGLLARHLLEPHRRHRPPRAPRHPRQHADPRCHRLDLDRPRDGVAARARGVCGHPFPRGRHRRLPLADRLRMDGAAGLALGHLRLAPGGGWTRGEHPVFRGGGERPENRRHLSAGLDLHLCRLPQPRAPRVDHRPGLARLMGRAGEGVGRLSPQSGRASGVWLVHLQLSHRRQWHLLRLVAPADAQRADRLHHLSRPGDPRLGPAALPGRLASHLMARSQGLQLRSHHRLGAASRGP